MEKTAYRRLDKKIRYIQNRLEPILTSPRNPETTQSDQLLVEEFHKNLNSLETKLSTEIATSDKPQHLTKMVKRVIRLQKAANKWNEGRHLTPNAVESSGFPQGLLIEPRLSDGEVTGMVGFKVYENPLFVGFPDDGYIQNNNNNEDNDCDCDYDDNRVVDKVQVEDVTLTLVADPDGVLETEAVIIDGIEKDGELDTEAVIEGVEKGAIITVDYQKVESKDGSENENESEEEEEENDDYVEGGKNSCYNIIFWGMIIFIGVISVMVGFSDLPDDRAYVTLLTPT